jgi:hypothetical protein
MATPVRVRDAILQGVDPAPTGRVDVAPSIVIVAHPRRERMAVQLAETVRADHVVWDHTNLGARRNATRAWQWHAEHTPPGRWAVVLEDDAHPADGFIPQVRAALAAAPTRAIVSLYLGRLRPAYAQTRIASAVTRGKRQLDCGTTGLLSRRPRSSRRPRRQPRCTPCRGPTSPRRRSHRKLGSRTPPRGRILLAQPRRPRRRRPDRRTSRRRATHTTTQSLVRRDTAPVDKRRGDAVTVQPSRTRPTTQTSVRPGDGWLRRSTAHRGGGYIPLPGGQGSAVGIGASNPRITSKLPGRVT